MFGASRTGQRWKALRPGLGLSCETFNGVGYARIIWQLSRKGDHFADVFMQGGQAHRPRVRPFEILYVGKPCVVLASDDDSVGDGSGHISELEGLEVHLSGRGLGQFPFKVSWFQGSASGEDVDRAPSAP